MKTYEIEIRSICGWGKHWTENDDLTSGDGGFMIGWSAMGIGFGELTVSFKDGKIQIDDECMSREFVEAVMKKLIEGMPVASEEDSCPHGSTLAGCTACQGGIP